MKISIIIPCRNAAPYLAQTLGSALDQMRPPDEVLVIDDGSDDGSLGLARRFEAAVPSCVRVFSEPSGHASRTRNLGASSTDADALMFLDADDVLRPDALGALEEALARRPEGIAVCPWFRLERTGGPWVELPPSCAPRRPGQDALSAWLNGWYHPPCSVLWSRHAFECAGRWDEQAVVNQDGDLVMRALVLGSPLIVARGGAGYYRRRPADEPSISAARFTATAIGSRIRTIEKIAAMLEQDGRLERHRPGVAAAFAQVAADARGRHEELSRRAHELARQYAPAVWERATRRLLRGRQPAPGSPGAPPTEVRWGIDRAERILAAGAAPRVPALRLPRRPAVTAVLPTYNRAHLLPRALDSALAQTYEDFELLVIDDGSSDDTGAVVRGYRDSRVRYLRQRRNAGVSSARNRGLREARGDLVAFLDSDDEWLPEKLALQVQRFGKVPERVGLVYGAVENEDGAGGRTIMVPTRRGNVYRELLLANVIHGTSGVMIRRSVVPAVGFFDELIPAIEDYDYWVRLARFFEVDFVEAPLIRYHDANAGERKSLDMPANVDARWWFYRKHAAEMRRHGVVHLFLRESVRRTLLGAHPDRRAARRIALQAVFEAPLSRMTVATLMRAALPRAEHVRWIQHHAALE